jgi:hypothetical protein
MIATCDICQKDFITEADLYVYQHRPEGEYYAHIDCYTDLYCNTNYCEVCSSCGESGCCTPDICQGVKLKKVIDSVLNDMEYPEKVSPYLLEQIQKRFNDGLYCEYNIECYKDMEGQSEIFYQALNKIAITQNLGDTEVDELRRIAIEAIDKVYPPYEGN